MLDLQWFRSDHLRTMFTLAHLSDPHLPLPAAGPADLLSKRVTGYLSWRMKRRHIHVPEALAAIVDDIRARRPDHIALTGDIANISLAGEFDQGAAWMRTVAAPDRLTVVPGNHDLYVPMKWAGSLGQWAPFMQSDGCDLPRSADDFPIVRRRGNVTLVGLSTAVPTAPLSARGALGNEQIARLDTILRALAHEDRCRVILIHHPPHANGAPWRKALADGAALRRVLKLRGADLILHGHNHRNEIGRIEGPGGTIPVLGVISASAALDSPYGRGGWHSIAVEREADAWRFKVEHRHLDDTGRSCTTAATFEVSGPLIETDPTQLGDIAVLSHPRTVPGAIGTP